MLILVGVIVQFQFLRFQFEVGKEKYCRNNQSSVKEFWTLKIAIIVVERISL